MDFRSLRSAPAQKASSDSLARIKARVVPLPLSRCRPSTTPLNSDSSCVERAFLAAGRFSESTVMLPECGAGTLEILMDDAKAL